MKRLQERRLNVWEQAKELLDTAEGEKRDLTAEEEGKYQALNADIDAIDQRVKDFIDGEKRAKDAEAAFEGLLAKPVDEDKRERGSDKPDMAAQLRGFLRGEAGRAMDIRSDGGPVDYRALVKGTAAAGGNTVKTSFYNRLVAHMIENSGLLSTNPTVLRTATGEQIQVPKTTAHSTSAVLVAENTALTGNEPTFGQVPLDAFKFGFLMQVSHELLNDTSVDLEGYLAMQAGRALGNGFGSYLITGTGSSQPNGVVTAATSGVTGSTVAQGASVIGAPTGDNLIDLFYSVIAPYRNSPSCAWLLKDASVATIRKLKDNTGGAGQGNYLWQPGLQGGIPDTILGKPVYTDPNVAGIGSAAKSVVFGDFSQYFVRQVESIRFERSDDFAFSSDLITFRVILRGDGDLVDTTGAIKFLTGGTV
jgi:HK97 family phage major capsid protein